MSYAPPIVKDSPAGAGSKYGHLLRVLGLAFGWAVTVGTTIGAGILRAPGEVAQHVPSVPAFYAIWLIGSAYALLGALTLAELGAMIPESGGQTVFVKRASIAKSHRSTPARKRSSTSTGRSTRSASVR